MCLFHKLLRSVISGCFVIMFAVVYGIDIFHFIRRIIGWCILSHCALVKHEIINLYLRVGIRIALFTYMIWLKDICLCLRRPVILPTMPFALNMSDFFWFLIDIQTPKNLVVSLESFATTLVLGSPIHIANSFSCFFLPGFNTTSSVLFGFISISFNL